MNVIREDINELAEKYNEARRTEVKVGVQTAFTEADLVRDEEVVILLTRLGYIKRVPSNAYRAQRRGGKGVMGMATKDEDGVWDMVSANSLDTLLFFTNRGRVYSERCYVVPEAARAAKGTLIHAFLGLTSDEYVTAIVPVGDFSDEGYFVLATRQGRIKRVDMSEFENVHSGGKIAVALDEGDTLNWAALSNGSQHVILVTESGQSIRFSEDRVRVLGRQAAGVNSMRLSDGDAIAGMDVLREDDTHILVVTRNGYGKRTPVEEYRLQGRYGLGIRTIARNEKTGPIVAMRCINPKDDILLITGNKSILRTSLESIRDVGRATIGVRLVRLDRRDSIVGIAILDRAPEDELAELDEGQNGESGVEGPELNGNHDVLLDDEDEVEEVEDDEDLGQD